MSIISDLIYTMFFLSDYLQNSTSVEPIEAPTYLATSERFVDEFDTVTGA
jgi:hypothetical protein